MTVRNVKIGIVQRVLYLLAMVICIIGLVYILLISYSDSSISSPELSNLVSSVGVIVGSAVFIFMLCYNFFDVKKFSKLNNGRKVVVMLCLLISFNWSLCSIQYQVYLKNKDEFIVNVNVFNEINEEINLLILKSNKCDSLKTSYANLKTSIAADSLYPIDKQAGIIEINDNILKIKLIPCVNLINERVAKVEICDSKVQFIYDDIILPHFTKSEKGRVGLSPKNHKHIDTRTVVDTTSLISGRVIIKGMTKRIELLEEHILYIKNCIDLVNNRGISFESFVFRNFESSLKDLVPKNYLIRLGFYFQILISIFIWGYITIVMYRIFDGKE